MSVRILTKLNRVKRNYNIIFRCHKSKQTKSETHIGKRKELCPPKSLWNLFGKKEKKKIDICKKKDDKPTEEECNVMREMLNMEEPDLSHFGGVPYRTCNPNAFVLQKNRLAPIPIKVDPENKMVEKIERDPTIKDAVDPMPPFISVEQRLIDLCEKKMHPLYKKYLFTPRKPIKQQRYVSKYKGKCSASNLQTLKTRTTHFDKKNIHFELKKMEPPDIGIAKMPEYTFKTTHMARANEMEDDSGQGLEELKKCQRKVCLKGV